MHLINYFILIPMVYAAFTFFILGLIWQSIRISRGYKYSINRVVGPEKESKIFGTLKNSILFSKMLKSHPVNWLLLIIFHCSFVLLFLGHLELISEIKILQILEHRVFLGGGFIGITLIIILVYFLFRRFHSPLREISDPSNYYILVLLLITVFLGSQMHLARKLFGYSTIGVQEYREYISGIITFHPVIPEIFNESGVGHSLLIVMHVFFANLVLIFFPMSKMMHSLLAIPLNRMQKR